MEFNSILILVQKSRRYERFSNSSSLKMKTWQLVAQGTQFKYGILKMTLSQIPFTVTKSHLGTSHLRNANLVSGAEDYTIRIWNLYVEKHISLILNW